MYKAWNNGRGFNTGTDKVQENGSYSRSDHLLCSDFIDRFILQEVFTKVDTIRRGRIRDTSGKTFSGYSISDDNGDNTDFIFWSNTQFSGMDGESRGSIGGVHFKAFTVKNTKTFKRETGENLMQDKEFLGIKPNFNDKMGFTLDLSVEKYEKDEETGKMIKSQFKKSAGSFIGKSAEHNESSEKTSKPEDLTSKAESEKPNVSRFNPLYNKPSEPKNTEEAEETLIFKDPKGF